MLLWGWAILATLPCVLSMTGARRTWTRRSVGARGTDHLQALPGTTSPGWQSPSLHSTNHSFPAGTTVLIIDDDDEIRDVTQMLLRRRGLEVLTAASGAQGLALFQEHGDTIHAVLLDLTMPDMNGVDVSRAMRALRPNVPIILSSGFSEEISLEHLEHNATMAFLQKPYTVEALLSKIDTAIAPQA